MSSNCAVVTQGLKHEPNITMKFNSDTRQVETFLHSSTCPIPYRVPGTHDEWGKFLDQYMPIQIPKPTPPEQFSQGTLELYKRAIKEPGSLTEEEACGCTWQALITNAVEKPQDLTSDEIDIILNGPYSTYNNIEADRKRIFGKVNLPAEIKDLWLAAQNVAKDPQYAIAESNALREGSRIAHEEDDALSHLSFDDKNNISLSMRIPWIAQLKASSKPHWGLVCFRTAYDNDEAWAKYKEHIFSSSRVALLAFPSTSSVRKQWKIHFVENDKERLDGASLEDLCKYFQDPPASSSISSAFSCGLRSDIFLIADGRAISSLNKPPSDSWLEDSTLAIGSRAPITDHPKTGYVCVCDPFYKPSEIYSHFNGVLKVNPAHISTTFYHSLWPRGQEKGAHGWWYYKQSIEIMYKLASGSNSREGGVYPPHFSHNL